MEKAYSDKFITFVDFTQQSLGMFQSISIVAERRLQSDGRSSL